MTIMSRKTTADAQNSALNWKLKVVDVQVRQQQGASPGTVAIVVAKKHKNNACPSDTQS